MPPLEIKFRRFTSLNTTIRLREGRLIVRLSDLLEHAPETIHHAIAHILLAKLYRKPIEPVFADRYRRYTQSEAVSKQAERIRQTRGRKVISSPQGHLYDLDEVFEAVNRRFFHGLLGRPTLTWSAHVAKRMLGHYDAAHNTIVVSRVFDRPGTPRYAIEYLLYHEMLHLKHPVRVRAGRRCVHSRSSRRRSGCFRSWSWRRRFEAALGSRDRHLRGWWQRLRAHGLDWLWKSEASPVLPSDAAQCGDLGVRHAPVDAGLMRTNSTRKRPMPLRDEVFAGEPAEGLGLLSRASRAIQKTTRAKSSS
jgi:hypothetical protein